MNAIEFKKRTKTIALRIICLVESLPATKTFNILGRQLLRRGTSVGANYRAACRGRSRADFISKMGIVEEESDEALHWMELLVESRQMKASRLSSLMKEAGKLLSMVVASIKTTKVRRNPQSAIRNPQSS